MLIDLLHIFWSHLKVITWLYGTFVSIWAIFGLRVIWRTMILAIMTSERGENWAYLGLRYEKYKCIWEWILHKLYKQSLHNICTLIAFYVRDVWRRTNDPFKILILKGNRWHFMACELRRRRQLFLQALVWQLPSLWLNPFSSLYKSTKYVLSWTDCFWIMNFLVPIWYKDHCDFF